MVRIFGHLSKQPPRPTLGKKPRSAQPALEILESRWVPTVTFRETAVPTANASPMASFTTRRTATSGFPNHLGARSASSTSSARSFMSTMRPPSPAHPWT
jgi:hypothetical protein